MTNVPNFCSKCGGSLAGRTHFCGYCGAPIMSTAIMPTKHPTMPLRGVSLLLGIGTVLVGAYILSHHALEYHAAHPADSPFWQPGPPADLLTMLKYGYRPTGLFAPPSSDKVAAALPDEAQIAVLKNLCDVIIADYHPYRYGSTQGDRAQHALVTQEAERLVEQTSQLYADRTTARHNAKYMLAATADALMDEMRTIDPSKGCKILKQRLDNPDRWSF
jgi:hypothetical protein